VRNSSLYWPDIASNFALKFIRMERTSMGPRHYSSTDDGWLEVPEEHSHKRSKKDEKRKRKLWEEDDLDDNYDNWDSDDLDRF